jgi:spore coat polysaccharide biosynthesis protein SpsF (cytidylyltransferase family)
MSIPVLIAARATSERLPGKHFLDLAGMTSIEHVVRRAGHFGFEPIVIVPHLEMAEFDHCDLPWMEEGDADNVETRALEVAHRRALRLFHLLDGDDPFFDPIAVLESLHHAAGSRSGRVTPSWHSLSGSGRMGTSFNLDAPAGPVLELRDAGELPWPQRLTLDYPEDYALIRMVAAELSYMAPRSAVDELFLLNPDLHKINWFRNREWKARQLSEQAAEQAAARRNREC